MIDDGTIVALATPAGPAARMIVRTSGTAAFELAGRLGADALNAQRFAFVTLAFDGLRVRAACYAFRGPRSHTGEDVVEYHLPGNPLLGRMLIETLVRLGARHAEPGEFSARAFFNGKLRLDEAEGVAAAIAATSDRALSAARRLRAGELARRLEPSLDALADLLALCELAIDFTEEDVVVLSSADGAARAADIAAKLLAFRKTSPQLENLGRPPRVALVGRPNAGKSTLLNALVGRPRAVASAVAGTTRDALSADVELPGGMVTMIDLAGLDDGDIASDPIEANAHRIALRELATADVLVLVRDVADRRPDPKLTRAAELLVLTKADLLADAAPAGSSLVADSAKSATTAVRVSAITGSGLDVLRSRLAVVVFASAGEESVALNARHRALVESAVENLREAEAAFAGGVGTEIGALHLRASLNDLGEILGTVMPDDLLGRIFGRFCIGK